VFVSCRGRAAGRVAPLRTLRFSSPSGPVLPTELQLTGEPRERYHLAAADGGVINSRFIRRYRVAGWKRDPRAARRLRDAASVRANRKRRWNPRARGARQLTENYREEKPREARANVRDGMHGEETYEVKYGVNARRECHVGGEGRTKVHGRGRATGNKRGCRRRGKYGAEKWERVHPRGMYK
jgi:hypothetical protein